MILCGLYRKTCPIENILLASNSLLDEERELDVESLASESDDFGEDKPSAGSDLMQD